MNSKLLYGQKLDIEHAVLNYLEERHFSDDVRIIHHPLYLAVMDMLFPTTVSETYVTSLMSDAELRPWRGPWRP